MRAVRRGDIVKRGNSIGLVVHIADHTAYGLKARDLHVDVVRKGVARGSEIWPESDVTIQEDSNEVRAYLREKGVYLPD
jgi:hypothetical protein